MAPRVRKESETGLESGSEAGPLEVGFDYFYDIPVVNSHPPFVYMENHRVIGLEADDPLAYKKGGTTQAKP